MSATVWKTNRRTGNRYRTAGSIVTDPLGHHEWKNYRLYRTVLVYSDGHHEQSMVLAHSMREAQRWFLDHRSRKHDIPVGMYTHNSVVDWIKGAAKVGTAVVGVPVGFLAGAVMGGVRGVQYAKQAAGPAPQQAVPMVVQVAPRSE